MHTAAPTPSTELSIKFIRTNEVSTEVRRSAPPQAGELDEPELLTRTQFLWREAFQIVITKTKKGGDCTSKVNPCKVIGPVACADRPGPALAQFTVTSLGLPVEDLKET